MINGRSPSVSAIWAEDATGMRLVARNGDRAPGTEAGTVFSLVAFYGEAQFNDAGQTAFRATLSGPGVNTGNDEALFATAPDGELMLLIREGQVMDLPGGPRTVRELANNFEVHLNDAGQMAVALHFVGGTSGLFMVTVPEPALAVVWSVFAVFVWRRRR